MNCKHCKSKEVVKNGTENWNQRYKCKKCGKQTTEQEKKESINKPLPNRELLFIRECLDLRNIVVDMRKDMREYEELVCIQEETIEDLKSRLYHADKVNLANVKLMQEKDEWIKILKEDIQDRVENINSKWRIIKWMDIL